jgi:two-component system OmpR family sensor kinase
MVRSPTISLFVQLLVLAGLTMVALQAISLVMIFSRPPPTPDFYLVSEIEGALHGAPAAFGDRRPLEAVTQDRAPPPVIEWRRETAIHKRLASDLGVSPDRLVISGDVLPFTDRRVFRNLRAEIARRGVGEDQFLTAPFQVAVRQDDGHWRVVRPHPHLFGIERYQQQLMVRFLLAALVMAPIIFVFARRLSAPIREFAAAAERLGRDPGAAPLATEGSAEIAVAVRAFNDMQKRLHRYVEDRTAMVGAIAHDLRTPLTRLRFRIENLPDAQRSKMSADIDEMEQMISAALTFVRDASQPGVRTPLELSSLLESLCDEMAETGAVTEVERGDKVVLTGDPVALRRLFSNLLENAVKFGGAARARVGREDASAIVEIDDDGPGIPVLETERVFEPFYRREPSRNRKTGGIGLGLAVVRSIARAHGGDVALVNRAGGGLTARVQLPL